MSATLIHITTLLATMAALVASESRTNSPFAAPTVNFATAALPAQRHAYAADMTIARDPDGLFYVMALVNSHPVRFVVDTGATVMVLTPRDAARLGIDADPTAAVDQLRTAGGSAPIRWGRAQSVTLAGRHVGDVRVALPSGTVHVSLLGQNVLSRMGPMLLEGDRLILK